MVKAKHCAQGLETLNDGEKLKFEYYKLLNLYFLTQMLRFLIPYKRSHHY